MYIAQKTSSPDPFKISPPPGKMKEEKRGRAFFSLAEKGRRKPKYLSISCMNPFPSLQALKFTQNFSFFAPVLGVWWGVSRLGSIPAARREEDYAAVV